MDFTSTPSPGCQQRLRSRNGAGSGDLGTRSALGRGRVKTKQSRMRQALSMTSEGLEFATYRASSRNTNILRYRRVIHAPVELAVGYFFMYTIGPKLSLPDSFLPLKVSLSSLHSGLE